MKQWTCSALVALFCSITSCVVCACGLLMKAWWQNVRLPDITYDIFTKVECKDYLCSLAADNASTQGWIILVQAMGVSQFVMMIAAVLFQTAALKNRNKYLLIAAAGAAAWSCTVSVLEVCILPPIFQKMTRAYSVSMTPPRNHVIYLTLPLGLLAISGTIVIPALVGIVITLMEGRKSDVKSARIV